MAATSWTDMANTRQAMDYFQAQGWTPQQAAGIVSNLHAESGLDEKGTGDKGAAYGIGQWHPDRQQDFQAWAGKPIQGSSLQDQLGFVQHELTQGAFRSTGDALQTAQTPAQASSLVMQNYERPADHAIGWHNDLTRAQMAEDLHNALSASTP